MRPTVSVPIRRKLSCLCHKSKHDPGIFLEELNKTTEVCEIVLAFRPESKPGSIVLDC